MCIEELGVFFTGRNLEVSFFFKRRWRGCCVEENSSATSIRDGEKNLFEIYIRLSKGLRAAAVVIYE